MDLMQAIVRHISDAKYDDLTTETVEVIKKLFLDTLGTTIAGTGATGSKALVDLAKDWGGKAESTIWVFGEMVPAHHAALVNCTMARALDLDDVHEAGGGHLSATVVPISLILAEYIGRPIKGKDAVLAIAIGADLICRLRRALTTNPGWLAETFSPFGVVAMAGKLMGFDEEHLANALGLAYSMCSTNLQANLDGALSVRLQQGIGAQAGVLAAILAKNGFTGAKNVFEGKYGLYRLYGQNRYNLDVVTDQLGKRFEIVNDSIKPYPCCKFAHMPIYATLEIMKEQKIDPKEITQVTVFTNSNGYNICAAGDNKVDLKNTVDAQFSIPYTVAVAAVRGKVFIDDFTEETIRDSDVLELARKVTVRVDPELDKIPQMIVPNRVDLDVKGGKRYSMHVEYVKGHPRNPMSMTECIEKFQQCVPFSAKPLNQAHVASIIELVEHLEVLDDVRKITGLLVAG